MLTLLAGERVLSLLAREKWEMGNGKWIWGDGGTVSGPGRQVGDGEKWEMGNGKNGKYSPRN